MKGLMIAAMTVVLAGLAKADDQTEFNFYTEPDAEGAPFDANIDPSITGLEGDAGCIWDHASGAFIKSVKIKSDDGGKHCIYAWGPHSDSLVPSCWGLPTQYYELEEAEKWDGESYNFQKEIFAVTVREGECHGIPDGQGEPVLEVIELDD